MNFGCYKHAGLTFYWEGMDIKEGPIKYVDSPADTIEWQTRFARKCMQESLGKWINKIEMRRAR